MRDRLNTLKLSMLRSGGSPELTAGAAELRALIPFFLLLVESWPLDDELGEEQIHARRGMQALHGAYECLHADKEPEVEAGALERFAFAFHREFVSLHALNSDRWVLKPKLHLFLEIGLERTLPSRTWLYRDESFGGDVARMSHRKGGAPTALAMSQSCLLKFSAGSDFPRICQ